MEFQNFTQVFKWRVEKSGQSPALRFKKNGKWEDYSWNEFYDLSGKIGKGLIKLGLENGARVNLFSNTIVEWALVDLGVLLAGGVVVPIYQSNTADEAKYIINNSDGEYLFVENNLILERLEPVIEELINVKKIILMKGKKLNDDDKIITLQNLMELGGDVTEDDFKERGFAKNPDDILTIIYTSGTTGVPKGAVITHSNVLWEVKLVKEHFDLKEGEISMLFLPLAHVLSRAVHWIAIYAGMIEAYAESLEKLMENIREVKPNFIASVPRIFEKIYDKITSDVEKEGGLKKKIFYWSLGVGRKVSSRIEKKQRIPFLLKLRFNIAKKLVFNKLKEAFGANLRLFLSAGAPLSVEIARFFHSADLFIAEVWGMTELTGAATGTREDDFKFGSVGKPFPGVELKLADDGELLVKGPIVMKEYFKMPEETKETIVDGWLHTGDIARIDREGYVYITDRKKDLIITSGGKNVAPQKIENMIKADRYINQIVVVGDDRKYLTALITLNYEEVERYAKEHKIQFDSYEDLGKNQEIFKLIESRIKEYNKNLASYETIKKFTILTGELTQEAGELTPTLKLKRRVIQKKYKDLIDKMYE